MSPDAYEHVSALLNWPSVDFNSCLQQLVGEFTPYRGSGLNNVLGRSQSVHPFHEQRVQTVRDGEFL